MMGVWFAAGGSIGFVLLLFHDFWSVGESRKADCLIVDGECACGSQTVGDDHAGMKHRLLKSFFWLGCLVVSMATLGMIIRGFFRVGAGSAANLVCLLFAILFFALLVYTLFFALPFEDTYMESDAPPVLCEEGMYALCRHPGVIWFFLLYACLGIAFPIGEVVWPGILFCVWNLFYVIVQDRYIFPRSFPGYGIYQQHTPFLIPNWRSLNSCIRTLHSGRR